jgi:DNA-binding LacI/PurR family transcriptional regulator/DNA-binding transcriptional regulator YhcF (GntR family)
MTSAIEHKQLYQKIKEILYKDYVSSLLKTGGRIPADSILATKLGVNVATVGKALNEMVHDGLVRRRVGSGTWVLAKSEAQRRVGIYFSGMVVDGRPKLAFYGLLDQELQHTIHNRGSLIGHYVDLRIPELHTQMFDDIQKDIQNGKLTSLIIGRSPLEEYDWFKSLNIPVVGFRRDYGRGGVFLDLESFTFQSVDFLKASNCKNVGLITATSTRQFGLHGVHIIPEIFFKAAADAKLHTTPSWVSSGTENPLGVKEGDHEAFGYEAFRKMWSQPERPDGILLYTDIVALGVKRAADEMGVQLGKDVRVICHANEENIWPQLAHLPQIKFSIKQIAEALYQLATKLEASDQAESVYIRPTLWSP